MTTQLETSRYDLTIATSCDGYIPPGGVVEGQVNDKAREGYSLVTFGIPGLVDARSLRVSVDETLGKPEIEAEFGPRVAAEIALIAVTA